MQQANVYKGKRYSIDDLPSDLVDKAMADFFENERNIAQLALQNAFALLKADNIDKIVNDTFHISRLSNKLRFSRLLYTDKAKALRTVRDNLAEFTDQGEYISYRDLLNKCKE